MNKNIMDKFMFTFLIALVVAGGGVVVGQFVPPVLMLPLIVLELILVVAVVFVRKVEIGYTVMYMFMFVSGVTLYAALSRYVNELGGQTVITAFLIAVVMFTAIAAYGSLTKFNFGFLGNVLFFVLLALVIITLVGLFVPFPNVIEMIISLVGILLFSAYTLYDFNKIAKEGLTEEEIPHMVVRVYLDFINLSLYILRFIGVMKSDD